MIQITVKKLKSNAIIPNYAHSGDAAMDLYSTEDYTIHPHCRQLVSTGIAMELPKGYWGNIRGKSGLALNYGIVILGGVIDSTYRGEYGVIILNTGNKDFIVKAGDKVAQVIIASTVEADIMLVKELTPTVRGSGAYGSTGK